MLLGQKFWRRAKRGDWYDRRAMLQIQHLHALWAAQSKRFGWVKGHLKERKDKSLDDAREGLYEAMEDEDTHLGMFSCFPLRFCCFSCYGHQYTGQASSNVLPNSKPDSRPPTRCDTHTRNSLQKPTISASLQNAQTRLAVLLLQAGGKAKRRKT